MKTYASLALLVVLAAGLAAPVRAVPPREAWVEIRTPHFTLFSNEDNKRRASELATDLERLRDVLQQLSPGLALNSPVPSYLYVFRDIKSFEPYQKLYNGQPLRSDGYFLA